jgi:hypothetical protein
MTPLGLFAKLASKRRAIPNIIPVCPHANQFRLGQFPRSQPTDNLSFLNHDDNPRAIRQSRPIVQPDQSILYQALICANHSSLHLILAHPRRNVEAISV